MSLELCVAASGSGGNCAVVRSPAGVVLIDLGIGPRTAAGRLKGVGVSICDVSAVCLTHLDRDHFSVNWVSTLVRQQIAVHCHASCIRPLVALCGDAIRPLLKPFDHRTVEILPELVTTPISLAHDVDGSHGFCFEGFGTRVGYATDLGRVTEQLIEHFCGCDIVAIESNYDPQMQQNSGRPLFLQRRITGGRGHLSNEQALSAIKQIFARSRVAEQRLPQHVVLLHRSRDCNCPDVIRKLYSSDRQIGSRVTIAEQCECTPWLRTKTAACPLTGRQLTLAWT